MITNLQVIEDALHEINVISEVDNASPEQGKKGLRRFNQMMELWKEDGIDFGWYSQSDTAETCPIPDFAELGITCALAVALASQYGATVSTETAAVGLATYNSLLRKSQKEALDMDNMDMSHLPEGAGHYGYGYDISKDS